MPGREWNNLDLLCIVESVCVPPFFGQKIDSRKIPQELFQKGVEIPVSVARSVIRSSVQDARFFCHNLCSQHMGCCVLWLYCSVILWLGVALIIINSGITTLLGSCFVLAYVLCLLVYLCCCGLFRAVRKAPVYKKLGEMNHQISNYNCLATVRNSRYGTAFHLAFFYYDITPCFDYLLNEVNVSSTESGNSHTDRRLQETQISRNQIKSLLMSCSAQYLYLFLDDILPEVTSQRHTIQFCCLCQYVEYKDPKWRWHITSVNIEARYQATGREEEENHDYRQVSIGYYPRQGDNSYNTVGTGTPETPPNTDYYYLTTETGDNSDRAGRQGTISNQGEDNSAHYQSAGGDSSYNTLDEMTAGREYYLTARSQGLPDINIRTSSSINTTGSTVNVSGGSINRTSSGYERPIGNQQSYTELTQSGL